MAEALGLMASILAVAGLAKTVKKFVKETKGIVRDSKRFRFDLGHSVSRVGCYVGSVDTAQRTLLRYCKSDTASDRPATIDFLDRRNYSESLRTESLSMQDQLEHLKDRILSLLEMRPTLFAACKWRYSLKEEVADFETRLSSLQLTLSLILACISLEVHLKRKDRDDIEIEHLKQSLKEETRQVRRLQKERSLYRLEPHPYTLSNSSDSVVLQDNMKIFLQMARAFIKTDSIPDFIARRHSPATTSTSTATTTPESSLGARQPPTVGSVSWTTSAPEQSGGVGSGQTHTSEPPGSSSSVTKSTASSSRPASGVNLSTESSSMYPSGTSRRHARTESDSSGPDLGEEEHPDAGSTAVRPPLSNVEAPSVRLPTRMPGPKTRSESSFIQVRPLEDVLKMVSSESATRVSGRFERRDGCWQQVSGIVEPEQTFNFISDSLVSELDLLSIVEPYTGEDCELWIETPGGRRIKPTGTMLRTLQMGPSHSRPIRIQLWVFPYHQKRNLVLGKPFVDKTRRYNKESV